MRYNGDEKFTFFYFSSWKMHLFWSQRCQEKFKHVHLKKKGANDAIAIKFNNNFFFRVNFGFSLYQIDRAIFFLVQQWEILEREKKFFRIRKNDNQLNIKFTIDWETKLVHWLKKTELSAEYAELFDSCYFPFAKWTCIQLINADYDIVNFFSQKNVDAKLWSSTKI